MQKNDAITLQKGRYRLIESLASGGQGTIWKVEGEDKQCYALKVVNLYDTRYATPKRHSDALLTALIRYANAEIAFLTSLEKTQQQHIAMCLDQGRITQEGVELPAFIMPLYHQDDLEKRIKHHHDGIKPISRELWLRWFLHLMQALQSIQAHSSEKRLVAHRDLKPANCLFDQDDNLFLSDFGIVRDSTKTGLTSVSNVGTRDFCAPEQCFARYEGEDGVPHFYITLKLDVYSAAMILHQILAGSTSAQQSLTETSIRLHNRTLYTLNQATQNQDKQDKVGKLGEVGGLTPKERNSLEGYLTDLLTPPQKGQTISFHQPTLPNYQHIATDLTALIENMLAPWPDDRPTVKQVLDHLALINLALQPTLDTLSFQQEQYTVVIGKPLSLNINLLGTGLPDLVHWLQLRLNHIPLEQPQIKQIKAGLYQLTLPAFSELMPQQLQLFAEVNGKDHSTTAQIEVTPDAEYLWTKGQRTEALRLELRTQWLDQWEKEATTVSKKFPLLEALSSLQTHHPQQAPALQQRYDRIDGRKSERDPLPLKKIATIASLIAIGTTVALNWQSITLIVEQIEEQNTDSARPDESKSIAMPLAMPAKIKEEKQTSPDINPIKTVLAENNLTQRQTAWKALNALIQQHENPQIAIDLKAEYEQQTLDWNKKQASKPQRKEALMRLQVLAQAGDGNAQYWLALRYLQGDGVKKDHAKGKQWVKKAADQGIENAQKTLNYLNKNKAIDNIGQQENISLTVPTKKPFEPDMVKIKAGQFKMGCVSGKNCEGDEKPLHTVKLSGFYLAKTEVTFEQWDACVTAKGCSHKPDDQGWGRGKRPVINVSWDDAQTYITWLNKETGKHYRLPSEAEWEYAARAGTTTQYSWGNQNPSCRKKDKEGANFNDCKNSRTEAVASYAANSWGLYDMHGNVWEWVQDKWHANYKKAPSNGVAWESGDSAIRVLRGGAWLNSPQSVRSAHRNRYSPADRGSILGFRLARSPVK